METQQCGLYCAEITELRRLNETMRSKLQGFQTDLAVLENQVENKFRNFDKLESSVSELSKKIQTWAGGLAILLIVVNIAVPVILKLWS